MGKHIHLMSCHHNCKRLIFTAGISILFYFCISSGVNAQQKQIDGQTFTRYKPGYFKPKRGLNYSLIAAAIYTVDPLGIGGKSTYGISPIANIRLWGSKSEERARYGLHISEWYTSIGYDFFPRQFDNVFASIGVRIKTFMPLSLRMDAIYSYGYGLIGTSTRFCVGFEIGKVTFFATGTTSGGTTPYFGEHPYMRSPYFNAGSIMLLIPVYNHEAR